MENESKQVDRETLYEEVWADPVIIVAKRYGLSDVGLAKICRKLAIPLPSRGYWAKLKAGKAMRKVPLPKLAPSKEHFIPLVKSTPEQAEAKHAAKKLAHAAREKVRDVMVPGELTDPHPLVKAAAKRLKQRDGWDDEKGLHCAPSEVLNLEATRTSLDRALLIVDVLLKELGKQGITAKIDPKASQTLLDVEGTLVEFSLTEYVRRSNHIATPAETKARQRYWNSPPLNRAIEFPNIPRFDYHATGILTLIAGRWPSRSWKDTERTPLEKRLGEIIAGIYTLAVKIREKNEAEARRREERRIAEERYSFQVQRYEDELSRFKALESDARNWKRANQLRAYVGAVERYSLENGGLKPEEVAWLEWARAKADWIDPLILVCDPILDAPEPKKPGYW